MLEPVVWNASLETGIRAIDLQHEELIGMLNELTEAINRQSETTVCQDILRRLDAYILFHFSTEESLMRGLAEAAAHGEQHQQQHRAFVARIASLRDSGGNAALPDTESLLHYLRSWLLEHIMQTDRGLAKLLQEAGVQP